MMNQDKTSGAVLDAAATALSPGIVGGLGGSAIGGAGGVFFPVRGEDGNIDIQGTGRRYSRIAGDVQGALGVLVGAAGGADYARSSVKYNSRLGIVGLAALGALAAGLFSRNAGRIFGGTSGRTGARLRRDVYGHDNPQDKTSSLGLDAVGTVFFPSPIGAIGGGFFPERTGDRSIDVKKTGRTYAGLSGAVGAASGAMLGAGHSPREALQKALVLGITGYLGGGVTSRTAARIRRSLDEDQ